MPIIAAKNFSPGMLRITEIRVLSQGLQPPQYHAHPKLKYFIVSVCLWHRVRISKRKRQMSFALLGSFHRVYIQQCGLCCVYRRTERFSNLQSYQFQKFTINICFCICNNIPFTSKYTKKFWNWGPKTIGHNITSVQ